MRRGICRWCVEQVGRRTGPNTVVELDAGFGYKPFKLKSYVCVACGYFENYLMNTEGLASLLASNGWTYTAPHASMPVARPPVTM